ncbi:hypothetical protein GCM10017673_48160 [Streptosporangium violaceochromogenes]|nr:hypothetical protein GCM10017673_48160 [Streptosporangium violaceochromogenes]
MENNYFQRALIMSSDLRGYGQGTDRRHEIMQRNFVDLHATAAVAAGLDRESWEIQPGGDGELAILPASESEPRVVDTYMRALHQDLVRRNSVLAPDERLRLRVALAFGTAYPSANGYAGQAVVEASRLVAWQPLKEIFNARAEVNIAVILSRRVFEDVVLQEHTSYREADFQKVMVRRKEFSGLAWVWAPEIDRASLSRLFDPAETTADRQNTGVNVSQRAEVITNMRGPVDARRANFGISRP